MNFEKKKKFVMVRQIKAGDINSLFDIALSVAHKIHLSLISSAPASMSAPMIPYSGGGPVHARVLIHAHP